MGVRALAFGLVIALLSLPLGARGSDLSGAFQERWRWVQFTTWSGLPSDEITEIVEGTDGVPWVATTAGLAWYDGHRWKPVLREQGLPAGSVYSLAARAGGGVACIVSGAAYTGDGAGFRRLFTPPGKVTGLAGLDDGGWFAVVDFVLYRLAPGGTAERVPALPAGVPVMSLSSSRPGRAVATTTVGVHFHDGRSWQEIVSYGRPGEAWAEINGTLDVAPDQVVFTVLQPYPHQGAWRWRRGEGVERIPLGSAETVRRAAVRRDGTLVLGFESGALGLASTDGAWSSIDLPAALGGVTKLEFRGNGDLWVGTARGLWLFRDESERWSVPERSSAADANFVHALLRASDGRLWVGTRAGHEIRGTDGRLLESRRMIGGRPAPSVTAIAQDAEGAVWLGSGSGFEGVWRYHGGEWMHFGEAEGFPAPHVHAIRVDSRGRPWFLGLSRHAFRGGPGAFVYEDGAFTAITPPGGERVERVYEFAEGPPGSYWFATKGGLFRLERGAWRSWLSDGSPTATRIFALAVDEDQRPWFSGAGRGLCHLPTDDELECESTGAGLPSASVWDLAFDASGALWASTPSGLGVRRDGEWSRILPQHGLPLLRLWPLLVDGERLLIGTKGRGLAELRLAGARHPAPRVSFEPPDMRDGFAGIAWSADAWWGAQAERTVETRWRIDGGDWSPWSRRRELVLEGLSHGGHALEVEAKGLFAQRGEPARVEFEMPAPLFARPEVLIPIALLLLTAAGWLGYGAWRRRAFAREIARREQRFSEILDNLADAVFTADPEGRLTSLNRAGLELAGASGADPRTLRWEQLLPADSRERAVEALRRKITQGGSSTYEIEVPGADGGLHRLEVRSRLVRVPGRAPEIQGVARDVTERRRLEAQLQDAQKRESLGLLAGGVAHDFNNLLLSILGNLDLARAAWRDGRSPRQAFDDLESAAERATDLARVMLAYSGKARFEIRPLDLSELAEEILRLLRASLPATVRFETELAAGLPAVEGDRAQVQQVILNLVTNAADAIGEHEGRIRVRTGSGPACEARIGTPAIDADFEGTEVSWLEVADFGPGIDPATRPRIFDPFFTTKGTGRGLGLSAVLGIVRVHGGALDLDSVPGKGASFRVLLPAVDAPAAPVDTRSERSRRHAEDLTGARVLVVDDEDRVRDVACRLLERAGCEVLAARDGLEAQEVVREQGARLDGVLLDLVMPRCGGAEALVAIREMAPQLPVVLTSGYTEQEASAREVGSGPTSFLRKPYRLADLKTALRAAFATRQGTK